MDSTMECLTDWMTRQRWYAGKGRVPNLVEVTREQWPSEDPDARVIVFIVRDLANNPPSLYHVPVVVRQTVPKGAGPALIGKNADGEYLFDGAHDPAYTTALLRRMHVHRQDRTARVHGGEQSNTSIIFDRGGEAPVVAKVFRLVHAGENPDVTLPSALTSRGYRQVPRMLGSVTGFWDDPHEPSRSFSGHLAFAQEFMRDVVDGWELALERAAAGDPFVAEAAALGQVTARIHQGLAEALPVRPATLGDIVGFVAGWHQRLAVASSDVPALRALRPAIEAVYDRAQDAPWPALQRVHGDYHLGQVLHRSGGEWVVVDFEGEPLRPLDERTRVDSPLRDVAGMLRSFDYVTGARLNTAPDEDARAAVDRAWSRRVREAFLDAYVAESGSILDDYRALLDAFELDKAVYEAMYEARNRPAWLPIPMDAVRALVAQVA
ncbi:trehalose synthase-fused probable maltokinase [Microcella putealis]|uniref:Maltokinase n=1 Tax=Microcella putealis TaxID=337005 RepID=A0A4V2EXD5_9MICO|nr:aminoglycoside phosphotransferase [Microcella putealis]RZS59110.1 trehalose synthase-fused probable maltokinase [Microcella putealis]TQM24136.1 trehalose synthase-fused probable maltokinase [Microcella putealis]